MTLKEALARLSALRADRALNEAEASVTEAAILGDAASNIGRGRALRVEAFRSLSGWSGMPFVIEERLAKSARGRFSWSSLALTLTPEQLKTRILGLGYAEAPDRWDDALLKLEQLRRSALREGLDEERYLSVKCRLLARLDWFGLVGELLWLPERLDDWDIWMREDGWAADGTAVEAWLIDYYHSSPFAGSGIERQGEYLDAASDGCWRDFDALIGAGDIGYMRSQGIRQVADGRFSF
jgi:hypothetical protein